MSLAALFDLSGTTAYRRLEREALEAVLGGGERIVIAAGGSIVTSPSSFNRLRDATRTVWLRATPAEHLARVLAQGDSRPMLGRPRALEELEEILERRAEHYARSELTIDTTGRSIEAIVAAIGEGLALEGLTRSERSDRA